MNAYYFFIFALSVLLLAWLLDDLFIAFALCALLSLAWHLDDTTPDAQPAPATKKVHT